jgi:hypothetical protein
MTNRTPVPEVNRRLRAELDTARHPVPATLRRETLARLAEVDRAPTLELSRRTAWIGRVAAVLALAASGVLFAVLQTRPVDDAAPVARVAETPPAAPAAAPPAAAARTGSVLPVTIAIDTSRFESRVSPHTRRLSTVLESPLLAEARLAYGDARAKAKRILARLPVKVERQ